MMACGMLSVMVPFRILGKWWLNPGLTLIFANLQPTEAMLAGKVWKSVAHFSSRNPLGI
jgi:hypothetical protein